VILNIKMFAPLDSFVFFKGSSPRTVIEVRRAQMSAIGKAIAFEAPFSPAAISGPGFATIRAPLQSTFQKR
jgi:hypothetical protein